MAIGIESMVNAALRYLQDAPHSQKQGLATAPSLAPWIFLGRGAFRGRAQSFR